MSHTYLMYCLEQENSKYYYNLRYSFRKLCATKYLFVCDTPESCYAQIVCRQKRINIFFINHSLSRCYEQRTEIIFPCEIIFVIFRFLTFVISRVKLCLLICKDKCVVHNECNYYRNILVQCM